MESGPSILLVEDNAFDEGTARRAIARAGIDCPVRIARDGAEACSELFDSSEPAPTLVLLDLTLPKVSGFEILQRMRDTDGTRRIPVVVLSGTDNERDVARSYDLAANSFLHKDNDLEVFNSRLKLVVFYWMAVNECSK
jgi:DNA-binding response OmpR family regulator